MSRFKKYIGVILIALILLFPSKAIPQTISVGSLLDEQANLQILISDSLVTKSVNRPLSVNVYRSLLQNKQADNGWWNRNLLSTKVPLNSVAEVGLLPFFLQNTINSKFPYSENNQAAWYGRGSTTEFMGGFYVTSKFLTVNFFPHIIYQENKDFLIPRFIPRNSDGTVLYVAEGIGTRIDAPFRFGPDSFSTFDAGNSSIRLHYKKLETGLSMEPLWWGPAVRYPLAYSNNAPGVPHFFLASREPINIPYVGDLQFRWILGYPKESKHYIGETQGNTRFMNAANIVYSPAFYKNLTIGLTRIYHVYEEDGFDFKNVTTIFDPFSRSALVNSQGEDEERQKRNQAASFYVQIRLPAAKAEIYAELYREDHSRNLRDFLNQPHHNGGYSFGFQKITYVPWIDFIKTNLEFTNLTSSQLRQVRPQTFIYTHSQIRHGHTNRGQILGAAIGPGSNSQFLSFDAYKGNYTFGIFAQRLVDNDNFHFARGAANLSPAREFGDYFRHRVNLNFGLNFLYGPGPIYLNSRLTWTKAYNYGRFDYGDFDGVTLRNYERNDLINIQFQIGLTYIL